MVKRGVSRETGGRDGAKLGERRPVARRHPRFPQSRAGRADSERKCSPIRRAIEGRYFADPIDGASYSRSAAKLCNEKGGAFILSFAHGLERRYELRSDDDDDGLDDIAIRERIEALHLKAENLDKLSSQYKALKDRAVALFARSSLNYRGDPDERQYFRNQWAMDAPTLAARLKEEDDKRRRKEETRRTEEVESDEDREVAELNKDHWLVLEGGKAFVFREQYDPVLKRKYYTRIKRHDFETAYMNRRVTIMTDNGPTDVALGGYWLAHPDRKQFLGGVVFDPGKRHRPDQFNLWEGFGVEPRRGSWKKFRKHLFKVVCRRDKKCFKYLMRWLANAVQHPEKQGEIVVVMRGDEGVGKGFLGRAMVRLFGRHGLHISSAKHLVGNFNAHLQDCCLLFADEAFFAGDKQHIGVLNAIATEPVLTIEGKGLNVVQSPNFIHLMMASNNDWVVPATKGARRYFVLDVSSEHKDDAAYFGAIQAELDGGGFEAMLYDLQRVKLDDFDVRKFPKTDALQDQKILSMKTEERWLNRVLSQQYVQASDFGLDEMEKWHEAVTTEFLFASYERYAKEQGDRHRLAPNKFGEALKAMGFTKRTQSRAAFHGEARRGQDAHTRFNDKRKPAYRLGPLAEAREAFAKAMGFKLQWPDEGEFDSRDDAPPF